MAKPKCMFCGKKLSETKRFCSVDCQTAYEKETKSIEAKTKWFLLGIAVGVVCMFFGVFTENMHRMASGIAMIGIIVVLFPFATPETVEWLGLRGAKQVARLLGFAVIAVAVTFLQKKKTINFLF